MPEKQEPRRSFGGFRLGELCCIQPEALIWSCCKLHDPYLVPLTAICVLFLSCRMYSGCLVLLEKIGNLNGYRAKHCLSAFLAKNCAGDLCRFLSVYRQWCRRRRASQTPSHSRYWSLFAANDASWKCTRLADQENLGRYYKPYRGCSAECSETNRKKVKESHC